ncbi:MAG: hypothetical protein ACI8PV_000802 [Dinoroseobacter sp.]|jgi:hypothetical protein
MKKLISLILAVAFIALVLMPYINGRVAEKAIHDLSQQLNADSLQYGEVEIGQYERGMWATDFGFKWASGASANAFIKEPLEFSCLGNHGTLGYSYQCKVLDVPAYTGFVNEYLAGYDPLTIGGNVSIFGTITQSIALTSFEMIDREGELIKFQPASLSISMDKHLSSFDIDGRLEGLKAQGVGGEFVLDNIELDGKLRTNQHNLAIGGLTLTLSSVALASDQDGTVTMNALMMTSQTEELGENIGLNYSLSIKDFERSASVSSEKLDLTNLQGEFSIGGANMVQVAKLSQTFQLMSQLPEEERNAAMLTLFPSLESLFKTGLNVSANAGADYKSEAVSGDAGIALVGDLRFSDFVLMGLDPNSFFSKFNAGLKVSLPQSLLDTNPQLAGALVGNPLYRKTEQGYTAEMKLADNEVDLNGRAMSVEEMLTLLSQSAP